MGVRNADTARRAWRLYRDFDGPKITVDPARAETIKYASNAFLAAKVGLANELANLRARIGVDWYRVAEGIGHDARIGPLFLRAGAGFGGSCFPKDLEAVSRFARRHQAPSAILEAAVAGNRRQPLEVVRLLSEELGSLRGKRVALLGLAFKADTDDVRETRALAIYRALKSKGARVVCHDPQAVVNFRQLAPRAEATERVEDALRGANACVIQSEWTEYRGIAPKEFVRLMRTPIVVDGRRTYDPAAMLSAGVRYRAIGLGKPRKP